MRLIIFLLIPFVLSLGFTFATPFEFMSDAEADKSRGNSLTETNSNKVCGDKLCSEIKSETVGKTNSYDKENKFEIVHVNSNISMLIGDHETVGSNIGVSAGNDGLLIVDDGLVPVFEDIKIRLDELKTCDACGDVEFLLNTHWHFDHVENNANFDKEDAVIVAHSNVRDLLSSPQEIRSFNLKFDASPKEALPVVTFDDSISIHFNGEEIKVIHLPNGHTNSDSIIYFTESNVLHLGDHFLNGHYPFIDIEHGGTIQGLTKNVQWVIDEFPSNVKIIPGHGSLATMNDLVNYHKMLLETRDIIEKQIKEGKTLKEIQDRGFPVEFKRWGTDLVNEPT